MMNRKQIAAVLLTAAMLLALCACGSGNGPEIEPEPELSAAELDYEEPYAITISYKYLFDGGWNIRLLARSGNTLLLGASQNNGYRVSLADYTVSESGDVDFSPLRELDIPDLTGRGVPYCACVTAGEDGNFYVVSAELPKSYFSAENGYCTNDGYTGEYAVCCFSANGELLGTVELHGWEYGGISSLAVNSEGKMLIYSVDFFDMSSDKEQSQYISVVAADGSVTANNTLDAPMHSLKAVGDKFCGMMNDLNDGSGKFVLIDRNTAEQTEAAFDGIAASYAVFDLACNDVGKEWIVMSGEEFYGIDLDTGRAETLFSMDELTWNELSFDALAHIGDGLYAAVNRSEGLILLHRGKIEIGNRQIVRIACCNAEYQARPAILLLNNTDSEYYYTLADVTPQQLRMQLMTDEAPDLVLMSFGAGSDAEGTINAESDVFEDLYPYLDADPKLNRNSFLPNFLEGLTTNGELHALYNTTMIYTLSALEKYVGDGKNLSIDDYRRIVAENGELKAMFGSWMTKSNLLSWLCSTCVNDFVDYSNGTCDFDNEQFKALLEWCNEMLPDYDGETLPADYPVFSEDEALLHLKLYQNYPSLENTYYPVCVGFPGDTDNAGYYYCAESLGMAIPTASQNKEGAWNFIHNQLIADTQSQLEDYNGIPVNMEAMQRCIDKIAVRDPAQAARITELLVEIKSVVSNSDTSMRETLLDCSKAYFNGDRSLDETAELIQNKMSIYMSEKYG